TGVMKKYLAVFLGPLDSMQKWQAMPEAERKEKEQKGMQAWMDWATKNKGSIVEMGSPLGKTKRVDKAGITDTRNEMGAWVVVQAESHEDAAKIFVDHPHYTIFPGERIEVMEMLPIPSMQ